MADAAQLSLLEYGRERRDLGMARASLAQDLLAPAWSELAYAAIVAVASKQAEVHVDDVLATFSIPPAHPNAFGAVWTRAIREGVLARTGTVRPSSDPKKHAHNYPVYQSLVFGRKS